MADLSKLSDADLDALSKGNLGGVSDEGLSHLSETAAQPERSTLGKVWDAAKDYLTKPAADGSMSIAQGIWKNGLSGIGDALQSQAAAGVKPDEGLGAAAIAMPAEMAPAALSKIVEYLKGTGIGPIVGRVARNAVTGGAAGAIDNPDDRLGGAIRGAEFGGVLGAGAEAAGASGQFVRDMARKFGAEKAAKALGLTKADYNRLLSRGGDSAVQDLGRQALDEKIVTPFATPSKIAARAGALKDEAGSQVGDLLDASDAGGAPKISARDIALDLSQDPDIAGLAKVPGKEGIAGKVNDHLNTLYQNGDTLSLRDAQKLRQGIDEGINFNKAQPEMKGVQPYLYDMRDALRDKMNDSVNQYAQQSGEAANQLLDANRRYSRLSDIERIATNRDAMNSANRAIGLTDTIAGAGGASAGATIGAHTGIPGAAKALSIAAGLVGGLGNKFARTYGPSLQATGADAVAKLAGTMPDLASLISKNPNALPLLQKMLTGEHRPSGNGSPDQEYRTPAGVSESDTDKSKEPLVHPEEAKHNFLFGK